MSDFEVAVVIPAAGRGERFSGDVPKQYFLAMGKLLIEYCVEAFLKIGCVKKICVVSDRVEYVQQLFEGFDKVMVVAGGNSRHLSIRNGLNALERLDEDFKVVVVHDGARPIVPEQLLLDLIAEADEHGAAGPTRPLTSTVIKPGDNGCVDVCLDRSSYVASETPQAFVFQLLYDAYQKASLEELEQGTECLALVLEHCGVRAKLIDGPDCLWKVTEKKDCYSSLACLRELSTRVCILAEDETEIVSTLKNTLSDKVAEICVHTSNEDQIPAIFNTVVCFHEDLLDPENYLLRLADALDTNTLGIIIHVVLDVSVCGTVDDFQRSGQEMRTTYEKLKKGVVIVHVASPVDQQQLIRLITSLVLNDYDLFSGQTLFI